MVGNADWGSWVSGKCCFRLLIASQGRQLQHRPRPCLSGNLYLSEGETWSTAQPRGGPPQGPVPGAMMVRGGGDHVMRRMGVVASQVLGAALVRRCQES